MIYQHRLVVSRGGRLDQRNEAFKSGSLAALDAHGSQLIGAWEVWVGPDPQASVCRFRESADARRVVMLDQAGVRVLS